jgi:hypothetical protein
LIRNLIRNFSKSRNVSAQGELSLWGLFLIGFYLFIGYPQSALAQSAVAQAALSAHSKSVLAQSTVVAPPESAAGAVARPFSPPTFLGSKNPFAPREWTYVLETGAMYRKTELFWLAGNFGTHIGSCFWIKSDSCLQYLDAIVGAGLREAETHGFFLTSLRWQLVNIPKSHSYFGRIFGGASHVARDSEPIWQGVGGVGLGVTHYLHERVDLRLEARTGFETHTFAQVMLGFEIKSDRLLEAFAIKLKEFGVGAVGTVFDATGTAVKATGEGISGIVEGVAAPFTKNKVQEKSQVIDQPKSSPARKK